MASAESKHGGPWLMAQSRTVSGSPSSGTRRPARGNGCWSEPSGPQRIHATDLVYAPSPNAGNLTRLQHGPLRRRNLPSTGPRARAAAQNPAESTSLYFFPRNSRATLAGLCEVPGNFHHGLKWQAISC